MGGTSRELSRPWGEFGGSWLVTKRSEWVAGLRRVITPTVWTLVPRVGWVTPLQCLLIGETSGNNQCHRCSVISAVIENQKISGLLMVLIPIWAVSLIWCDIESLLNQMYIFEKDKIVEPSPPSVW